MTKSFSFLYFLLTTPLITLHAADYTTQYVNLQQQVNAIVALTGYTLTPDVTTGSISISNDSAGNPDLGMTSVGGGFTLSNSFPLYLEGTAGVSRYDPTFVLSDGQEERTVPVKWNSISATLGIGWDFYLTDYLIFRPILNGSIGSVASDASLLGSYLEYQTGSELDFLLDGQLNTYGVGGTLMLDVEDYTPDREIDIELRYTDIALKSYSDTSQVVEGNADATTLSLWSRWRAPTGLTLMDRPVRYVLEAAHTQFYGDLDGALGFDALTSVGLGFELDSSAYDIVVTRTRLVFRYKFGNNVEGTSVGLAISF